MATKGEQEPQYLENKIKCPICGNWKNKTRKFYLSNKIDYDAFDHRCFYCIDCLNEMCFTKNGIPDIDGFKNVLENYLDRPFFLELYKKSLEDSRATLGAYNSRLNTGEYKNKDLRWADGETGENKEQGNQSSQQTINSTSTNFEMNKDDLKELTDKYGFGYPSDEYYLFEKKYQQLRPSIQLLTTMHDEFFREYCVDKVKETLAKARGEFKEAKEWASMAKDASNAGKLQPSQMSKADLSGGLDTFGQLSRTIEQTQKGELLKILPKFIEKPKDKVDIVLWLHVNAIRDIKGLPPCEYKEIYKFYEEKRESYERQTLDNNEENSEGDEDA